MLRTKEFASMRLADIELPVFLLIKGKIMKVKTNLRAGSGGGHGSSSIVDPIVFLYNAGPVVPTVTQVWSRCAGVV
jgi:hypothetical protein